MCESPDSHFFRTTARIQSGSHGFDESRLVMTLNNFGSFMNIMQFQISSRRKVSKEIFESSKFKFLERFLTKKFA